MESSCGEFLLNSVFCRFHLFQPQSGIYELRIGQNRHVGELHQPNIESSKDDSLSKKLSVEDFYLSLGCLLKAVIPTHIRC